jgi:hypothetical protein
MGGAGKGEPPEDRGERVISEAVERSDILFSWYAERHALYVGQK